jgi:hypothetical protein
MGRQRKDGDPFGLAGTRLAYRHSAFYYRHRDGRWERVGTDLAAGQEARGPLQRPGRRVRHHRLLARSLPRRLRGAREGRDLAARTLSDYRKDAEP